MNIINIRTIITIIPSDLFSEALRHDKTTLAVRNCINSVLFAETILSCDSSYANRIYNMLRCCCCAVPLVGWGRTGIKSASASALRAYHVRRMRVRCEASSARVREREREICVQYATVHNTIIYREFWTHDGSAHMNGHLDTHTHTVDSVVCCSHRSTRRIPSQRAGVGRPART